jgi:hypothetical protein
MDISTIALKNASFYLFKRNIAGNQPSYKRTITSLLTQLVMLLI